MLSARRLSWIVHPLEAAAAAAAERLGALFPTPGYCDEEMFFFRVSGLSVPEHEAELDEELPIVAMSATRSFNPIVASAAA